MIRFAYISLFLRMAYHKAFQLVGNTGIIIIGPYLEVKPL